MRRIVTVVLGLAFVLGYAAREASAQRYYPRGYGGYGMAGWGGDPAAAYLSGLGTYARGRGVYELDHAKAKSINVDTAIKWNKALREHQKYLREQHKKQRARHEAKRQEKLSELRFEAGATLNDLLAQIYDLDPAVSKASRSKAPLSGSAIREIPFDWNSEALTACIDELTGQTEAMPVLLRDAKYVEERNTLRSAVEPALEEDARGSVSLQTRKRIHDAVANLRAKFLKNEADYEPGYREALDYLTTLAAVNRMLNDPSMKELLAELKDGHERTVGDLITFMNAYNLRFGPVESDRQKAIYERLVPVLTQIRDELNPDAGSAANLHKTGQKLREAAQSAFKAMDWKDIQAHSRDK